MLPVAMGDEAGGKQLGSFADWKKQIAKALGIREAKESLGKIEWHVCQNAKSDLQSRESC